VASFRCIGWEALFSSAAWRVLMGGGFITVAALSVRWVENAGCHCAVQHSTGHPDPQSTRHSLPEPSGTSGADVGIGLSHSFSIPMAIPIPIPMRAAGVDERVALRPARRRMAMVPNASRSTSSPSWGRNRCCS